MLVLALLSLVLVMVGDGVSVVVGDGGVGVIVVGGDDVGDVGVGVIVVGAAVMVGTVSGSGDYLLVGCDLPLFLSLLAAELGGGPAAGSGAVAGRLFEVRLIRSSRYSRSLAGI